MNKYRTGSDRGINQNVKNNTSGFKPADGNKTFPHKSVEAAWKQAWSSVKADTPDLKMAKEPFYNLMMFPYPSAEGLHIGNVYAFTGSDIYGRFRRMQGRGVFQPIGLDGFGIHSENYALKIGKHPMELARVTQERFYSQLSSIGAMFDWTRTLETYNSSYYRWTQWLFIQMFKRGLAYRGKATVNWCPSCMTVLADEQVIDGKCERCGKLVEKRLLEQWFFKITEYAGKLLSNITGLNWTAKVKTAQNSWIGKKQGINITYPVVDAQGTSYGVITCFTTRPDTNFGATFVVLAPEHPFIQSLIMKPREKSQIGSRKQSAVTHQASLPHHDQIDRITNYVKSAAGKTDIDRIAEGRKKTGVFTGYYCINQLTDERMPVYLSDFVLMSFGTGAVVGVPGHDRRDFEFATVFKLPVVRVVKAQDDNSGPIDSIDDVQEEEGIMVNSDFLNGLDIHRATQKMMDYLEQKGWGKRVTTYHLRDWLISRQRYWGPPIPMIYCSACAEAGRSWFTTDEVKDYQLNNRTATDRTGHQNSMTGWYPVPEKDLPLMLPRITNYKPGKDGVAPLAKDKEFCETDCPACGAKARRESDVSDTFLDSSWYFLRYPSIGSDSEQSKPFDPDITRKWLPVNMYTGGAEHSVLHLLYSRFITMALHDWGFIDFEEPFSTFFAHGLVIKDGAKMSKSKGNVVIPDEYIETYGSDALRLYLMFMGPFGQGGDFRDTAMEGMSRWVNRIWRMAMASLDRVKSADTDPVVRKSVSKLIKKVGDDTEKRRYNTAIASMMEFTNEVADRGGILPREVLKTFLLLLAPYAPFLSEELWQRLHGRHAETFTKSDSVHLSKWPEYSESDIEEITVQLLVQVNGKLRDKLDVPQETAANRTSAEQLCLSSEKVKKFITGKPRKVIFVPGRLINFVV